MFVVHNQDYFLHKCFLWRRQSAGSILMVKTHSLDAKLLSGLNRLVESAESILSSRNLRMPLKYDGFHLLEYA